MTKLDNINYEFIDYSKYQERLHNLLINPHLQEYGISKLNLGKTTYGYDIDCLKLGHGPKHIFLVGGTHGSEIISVDYVTQLLNNIPHLANFSPADFTLFVIPLQNPEGFIISTDSLNEHHIATDFKSHSYDYYKRYKMDNLIRLFIRDYNTFLGNSKSQGIPPISLFIKQFQQFLNENNNLKKLQELIPELSLLVAKLNQIENIPDYNNFRYTLIKTYQGLSQEATNPYFLTVLTILTNYSLNHEFGNKLSSSDILKFHQEMFADLNFQIRNFNLRQNVLSMYRRFGHAKGSQVAFDATGTGINLNENHPLNPGLKIIRQNDIFMAVGARNNLRNYVPGPIGVPTLDIDNFAFAPENKALYRLLKQSYTEGKYYATFLFHSTGGMIFYKPDARYLENESYQEIYNYNRQLADIYHDDTDYKLIESSDFTGYGDLLRRTFPGVLLIELSKMGGNPIAPYGDENNIYKTYTDNFAAFDHILNYLHKKTIQNNPIINKIK